MSVEFPFINEWVKGRTDREISSLLAELASYYWSRIGMERDPLLLKDASDRTVGCLIPAPVLQTTSEEDQFIRTLRSRVQSPPDRFLTEDEFLAKLGAA